MSPSPCPRWPFLVASMFLASCVQTVPATEVIVVVHSDPAIGEELDTLEVWLLERDDLGNGAEPTKRFSLAQQPRKGQFRLPLSFSVAPKNPGSSADFRLVVSGSVAGVPVVEQQAIASFTPRKSLRLDIFLALACRGELCDEAGERTYRTCDPSEKRCERVPVQDALVPWQGRGSELGDPRAEVETGDAAQDGAEGDARVADSSTGIVTGADSAQSGTEGEVEPLGEEAIAALGARCAREGERACASHAGRDKLLCRGGLWSAVGGCDGDSRCNTKAGPDQGVCLAIEPACLGRQPGEFTASCSGDDRLRCGPDLLDVEPEACPDNAICREGAEAGAASLCECGPEDVEQQGVCVPEKCATAAANCPQDVCGVPGGDGTSCGAESLAGRFAFRTTQYEFSGTVRIRKNRYGVADVTEAEDADGDHVLQLQLSSCMLLSMPESDTAGWSWQRASLLQNFDRERPLLRRLTYQSTNDDGVRTWQTEPTIEIGGYDPTVCTADNCVCVEATCPCLADRSCSADSAVVPTAAIGTPTDGALLRDDDHSGVLALDVWGATSDQLTGYDAQGQGSFALQGFMAFRARERWSLQVQPGRATVLGTLAELGRVDVFVGCQGPALFCSELLASPEYTVCAEFSTNAQLVPVAPSFTCDDLMGYTTQFDSDGFAITTTGGDVSEAKTGTLVFEDRSGSVAQHFDPALDRSFPQSCAP